MYKIKRDCLIRFSAVGIMMAVMIPLSAHVKNMRCEYINNPIGIDTRTPRLSWTHSDGDTPVECKVELSEDPLFLSSESYNADDLWTAVVNIRPVAGKKYYWRVITKDSKGNKTVSPAAEFETGKFGKDQWVGEWISDSHDIHFERMPMFRHSFSVAENHGGTGLTNAVIPLWLKPGPSVPNFATHLSTMCFSETSRHGW